MNVTIAKLSESDLQSLDDLGRHYRNTLGFLTTETLREYLQRGRVFGATTITGQLVGYSLMASNMQLRSIVQDYADKEYQGKDATTRPDLLLAANAEGRHLLVEFKRPSITVGRDAESQALKYADTLSGELGISLDILIVGGQVDAKLQSDYSGKRTKFLAYRSVIATARTQLEWLLSQLNEKP